MDGGGDQRSPCELGGERAATGDRRYDIEDTSPEEIVLFVLFPRQIKCNSDKLNA